MTGTTTNVRRATRRDSTAAAAVVRAAYDEYGFTWDAERYHADLSDVEAAYPAFFVAERNGKIVGTAALGAEGSLERLYVLSSARANGLGAALLRAVITEARGVGHTRLEIWTDKVLTDAHRLYERFGFWREGERVNDDPDASEEWRYVRPLEGASVFLLDELGRVLLVRQNYGRRRWGLPGGAVDPGETPAQAAIRETLAETGLEVTLDGLVGSYGLDNAFVSYVFAGSITAGEAALPPTGELSDLGWFDPAELPVPQTSAIRFGVPDALAGGRDIRRENLTRD